MCEGSGAGSSNQDGVRTPGLPWSTGTQEIAKPGSGALRAEDLGLDPESNGQEWKDPKSAGWGCELGAGDRSSACRVGLQVRRGQEWARSRRVRLKLLKCSLSHFIRVAA